MSTQETSREKIKRTDKTKVNMQLVEELHILRRKRNEELNGTGQFCNLYPNINKTVCSSCSNFEICSSHKIECEYIHTQEGTKGIYRRKRKQENPKKLESEISAEIADADDAYSYEDQDIDPIAKKYPCNDMYYACPDKDECEYGEKCSYKPENG